MMELKEAKAVAKTIRIAPRKTRLIINLIRGKKVTNILWLVVRNNKERMIK